MNYIGRIGITLVFVMCFFFCGGSALASADSQPVLVQETEKHIKEIYQFAKEGKTFNSGDFKLGSRAKDIKDAWGEEDIYPTFERNVLIFLDPRVTFGLDSNKEMVTGITSELSDQVTSEDIITTLGKPDIEVKYNKSYSFTSQGEGDFKLEYVVDPKPNHVGHARYVLSFYFKKWGSDFYKRFTVRYLNNELH